MRCLVCPTPIIFIDVLEKYSFYKKFFYCTDKGSLNKKQKYFRLFSEKMFDKFRFFLYNELTLNKQIFENIDRGVLIMKNKTTLIKMLIKTMFGCSILFVVLYWLAYLWGISNYNSIYPILDCTLPFAGLAVLSMIGLGASQHWYLREEEKKEEKTEKTTEKNVEKSVKNYEKRYIVKTYGRDGVHTKRINVRGDYGLLRSA